MNLILSANPDLTLPKTGQDPPASNLAIPSLDCGLASPEWGVISENGSSAVELRVRIPHALSIEQRTESANHKVARIS